MKKSYDSKFKSRVALEALRGDLTRHEVPQSRTSFVLQPIEKICGEKQKTKKISFSICFMVRDAGFDKARSAAEQNKFCSATHQKNLRRETENKKKISFSLFVLWCATRDLNPHAVAKEPKSFVSANSTSRARCVIFYYYTPEKLLIQYQISQIKQQIFGLRLVFFQFRYIFYIRGNFKTPQKS